MGYCYILHKTSEYVQEMQTNTWHREEESGRQTTTT